MNPISAPRHRESLPKDHKDEKLKDLFLEMPELYFLVVFFCWFTFGLMSDPVIIYYPALIGILVLGTALRAESKAIVLMFRKYSRQNVQEKN
jgi:hypothetical protein